MAYHEAGHAVMAHHEGLSIAAVSIVPDKNSHGRVRHHNPLWRVHLDIDGSTRARLRVEKVVRVCLAGPIAQRHFRPKSWRHYHGEDDFRQAGEVLFRLCGSDEEVAAYWKLLDIQARKTITNPRLAWPQVQAVAQALLERRALKGKEVREIIYATTARLVKEHTAKASLRVWQEEA